MGRGSRRTLTLPGHVSFPRIKERSLCILFTILLVSRVNKHPVISVNGPNIARFGVRVRVGDAWLYPEGLKLGMGILLGSEERVPGRFGMKVRIWLERMGCSCGP